jgi:hypothetical protein
MIQRLPNRAWSVKYIFTLIRSDRASASRGQVAEVKRIGVTGSTGALLCAVLILSRLVASEAGFAGENVSAPQNLHVAGLDVAAWIPKHDIAGGGRLLFFAWPSRL